jgi:hypothetical protein
MGKDLEILKHESLLSITIMEQHIMKADGLKDVQEEVPFLIFVPREREIRDITYRREGNKWATIRYFCEIGDETLRVKEFFLDWFYPGFPKSLMDSFVSTYGPIMSRNIGDRIIFYGKNYKGKQASSSFALGTQIEVEGEAIDSIAELSESLFAPYLKKRFKNYPFHKRSFFARGGRPEWFEEKRIERLKWNRPPRKVCFRNLCAESLGELKRGGEVLEYILVFSEDYYKRVIWVDSASLHTQDDHLFYELRNNGNFFDQFAENGMRFAFRGRDGPAVVQIRDNLRITTVTFSPLFSRLQVQNFTEHLKETLQKLENFI